LPGAFLGQSPRGQSAQLVVDQRQQVLRLLRFASGEGVQDLGYFGTFGLDWQRPSRHDRRAKMEPFEICCSQYSNRSTLGDQTQ
jgi:hypothetical protein